MCYFEEMCYKFIFKYSRKSTISKGKIQLEIYSHEFPRKIMTCLPFGELLPIMAWLFCIKSILDKTYRKSTHSLHYNPHIRVSFRGSRHKDIDIIIFIWHYTWTLECVVFQFNTLYWPLYVVAWIPKCTYHIIVWCHFTFWTVLIDAHRLFMCHSIGA